MQLMVPLIEHKFVKFHVPDTGVPKLLAIVCKSHLVISRQLKPVGWKTSRWTYNGTRGCTRIQHVLWIFMQHYMSIPYEAKIKVSNSVIICRIISLYYFYNTRGIDWVGSRKLLVEDQRDDDRNGWKSLKLGFPRKIKDKPINFTSW